VVPRSEAIVCACPATCAPVNQALFERLLVHDDRITGAEIAEPFATLADPDLPQRLDGGATGRTAASSGGGSNEA